MIRCDPSQSELIRPGLAVRVDPVQLLYPPNVRHGWISCISNVWFLLYEAFSPSLCTVFSKIVRGSLLNEFEQTLYDSIIEIFWNVFLMLNTCALHFKLDYCKGVRQGCLLSPMLFNLYLDEIPFLLDQGDTDPIVLLSVYPKKIKIMIFEKKYRNSTNNKRCFHINGHNTEIVNNYSYLGITFHPMEISKFVNQI